MGGQETNHPVKSAHTGITLDMEVVKILNECYFIIIYMRLTRSTTQLETTVV
jgi:hypothetical protein